MKKRIIQTIALVLLCTLVMQLLAGCGEQQIREEWNPNYEKAPSATKEETPLSAKKVAGTYTVNGTWTSLVYKLGEPVTETKSITVVVKYIDDDEIDITLDNLDFVCNIYDPETGKVECYNKEFGPYNVTFTEEDGKMNISIVWDYKRDDGESKGSYTGTKS